MLLKIISLHDNKEKINELESLFRKLPDKTHHATELKMLLDLYIGTNKYKKAVKTLGQLQSLMSKKQNRIIARLHARILAMRQPLKTVYFQPTHTQIIQWEVNEICTGSSATFSETRPQYEMSPQR